MPRTGLLTYRSVSELLDCSEDTVRRLVQKGLLPEPQKYEGIGVRFRAIDVELYVALQERSQAEKARSRKPQEAANSDSEEDE